MSPVVVTASTLFELSLLREGLGAVESAEAGHLQAFRGTLAENEIILAVTGIGKVNAACATTLLLERFRPRLLVNTGCAGAFPEKGLGVGDLALACCESFADEGVETPEGWRPLDVIGIPVFERNGLRIFNRIPLSRKTAQPVLAAARDFGERCVMGPFLTVSTCSGTTQRGDDLLERFPGICENMEGGAVAQVALHYGTDLFEVRGISNMVEDRDLSRWDLKGAVERVQRFLLRYLEKV